MNLLLPHRLRRWALDLLLPPRCMLCSDVVTETDRLCAACWPKLDFIAAPLCPCCGTPFATPVPEGLLCAACLANPPGYRRARAALVYGGAARDLVLRLKRADRTDLAGGLANLMAQAGADLLAGADCIAPVPLHRSRLWRRRYNQSALLAQALGRQCGLPVVVDLLQRMRATPSLGGLGRQQRQRALAGAIRLNPARARLAAGARVVLVDDVFTTGATVTACLRALHRGGAASVDVLTLSKVVRPEIV